jgi:hypothetical protein
LITVFAVAYVLVVVVRIGGGGAAATGNLLFLFGRLLGPAIVSLTGC